MSPLLQVQQFAQSVYLATRNRYFDGIDTDDGATYVAQIIDWTNQFVDELENELGSNGQIVDWWFMRENDYALGAAALGDTSIAIPTGIDRVIAGENRYITLTLGGVILSQFAVVNPRDISNRSGILQDDLCAIVGTNLVFSRPFKASEVGCSITGDVILSLPRLSLTKTTLLSLVKPKQLLILGVAKNNTLPDIVQGGLSPSYVQKFQDLLTNAIARSEASSQARIAARQSFSNVRGV